MTFSTHFIDKLIKEQKKISFSKVKSTFYHQKSYKSLISFFFFVLFLPPSFQFFFSPPLSIFLFPSLFIFHFFPLSYPSLTFFLLLQSRLKHLLFLSFSYDISVSFSSPLPLSFFLVFVIPPLRPPQIQSSKLKCQQINNSNQISSKSNRIASNQINHD